MAGGMAGGTAVGMLGHLAASRAPLVAFAALGIVWGSYAAMVPDTKAMLGIDDATWGLLFLCSSAAGVAAMLVAPRAATLLGRWSLPVATVILGAAFALPGLMPVLGAFALSMAFVGLGSGLLDVLMNARVSTIETERRLHLMNLNHAFYSLGYAAGALATGAARSLGAGPEEVLPAAAAVVILLAAGTLEREARIDGQGRRAGPAPALGLLPVLGGLVVFAAFLAENAAEAWSALHIERTLGGSPAEGSAGPALLGLTMAAGRLAGQAVVARVAEGPLLRWALVVAAAGMALAAVAPTPIVAQAGFVVLGLGVSVVAPTAFALVGRLASAESRARAIARVSVLGYLGFFFGPPALGALAELFDLRMSFLAVAGLLLGTLPLVAVLVARGR